MGENSIQFELSATIALLADRSRASIVSALMDGRAIPAGELARRARISPPTASTHLQKLLKGGLISARRQGRSIYYQLASADIAQAIEQLSALAPLPPVRSLNQSLETRRLAYARTCYDHLAGKIAVRLTRAFIRRNLLVPLEIGFILTENGVKIFSEIGVDIESLPGSPIAAKACLDWTERRDHLGGRLGAMLLDALLRRRCLVRAPHDRALILTSFGEDLIDSLCETHNTDGGR